MQAVGHAMLRLLGWRVGGRGAEPAEVRGRGGAAYIQLGLHRRRRGDVRARPAIGFLGKHTLFPLAVRRAHALDGGIPVDRASPTASWSTRSTAFIADGARILAIAPEGTRSAVPHFKSGFLQIARGARVPVVLASLDYAAEVRAVRPDLRAGRGRGSRPPADGGVLRQRPRQHPRQSA
jgi:1-acyl-sn-glycerol-3-phosphate acyltransferase